MIFASRLAPTVEVSGRFLPCGFSNLGFIFNNWAEAGFKQSFLDEFADWLDQPVAWVQVEL